MKYLFVILLFSNAALAMGGVVNKGGDTVRCATSPMGPGGYYVLDYALAVGRGADRNDFVAVTSWPQSRERLQNILASVNPGLAASFEEFAESTEQIDGTLKSRAAFVRRWVAHKGRPLQVEDIGDISNLPAACKYRYKPGPLPKFSLYRLVQRNLTEHGRVITYRYDHRRLYTLRSQQQKSFLMVHEWLWDLTEDVEVNRQVNAFLHSKRLDSMTAVEIGAELKRLGL